VTLAAAPSIAVASATGIDARVVLAGPGARSIAFVLDWMIRSALTLAYLLIVSFLVLGNLELQTTPDNELLFDLVGYVPAAIIYFLYHVILEPLMGGRTPGKRMIGLRILTLEGVIPGVGALLIRNVFRLIDSMPVFYMVGLLFVIFGRRHSRIGDLAAGTVLAVERAPFLEKIRPRDAPMHEARHRALALGKRHGSEVADALASVDDYRSAAHAVASGGNEYLEAAYADLHDAVHRPARRNWLDIWSMFRDRVPVAMHGMRVHLLAVSLLFVCATVTGWWLVYTYPDLIAMFAQEPLIATVERGELWTDGLLNVVPSSILSLRILTNNIVVSLFAFCSGIIFGIGTLYLIGLNGVSLGAIFALTQQHELHGRLFDFIVAHGCVELSCICLSGAAGAYVGEALVRPGTLTRAEAFRRATAEATPVLVVVVLLLLVCGFIEGYVSPDPEIPRWARITIGVGYWLFMVSLLRGYVFGRSRGGEPIST